MIIEDNIGAQRYFAVTHQEVEDVLNATRRWRRKRLLKKAMQEHLDSIRYSALHKSILALYVLLISMVFVAVYYLVLSPQSSATSIDYWFIAIISIIAAILVTAYVSLCVCDLIVTIQNKVSSDPIFIDRKYVLENHHLFYDKVCAMNKQPWQQLVDKVRAAARNSDINVDDAEKAFYRILSVDTVNMELKALVDSYVLCALADSLDAKSLNEIVESIADTATPFIAGSIEQERFIRNESDRLSKLLLEVDDLQKWIQIESFELTASPEYHTPAQTTPANTEDSKIYIEHNYGYTIDKSPYREDQEPEFYSY